MSSVYPVFTSLGIMSPDPSQPIMLIVLGMLFSLGVIFIVILYDYRKLNKTINYEGFLYIIKKHIIYII